MSFPMLTTRLTVPPLRADLIDRPRLVAELQASHARGVRLVLISAPAGSGKSTLAGAWASTARAQADLRFAWFSLDPADNEALRFWSGLIGALQIALPRIGQAEQRMLAFSEAPPLEAVLTGLLNQIGARSERVVVVLDDYHLVTEPSVHDGLTFLLEHMPANLQLVLCTRADPPLPLSRLRVRAQLLEVRAADLFFTLPESERLINGVMGIGLSAGDLAALAERTEGWAAGVQLAAVLLMDERRKSADGAAAERLSALVTRLSGRHHLIADYLLDEVLSRQSETVQRFLLESSVLDVFCAPLCAELLGEDPAQSQAVLETLDRGNLFLIPLDEERTWFRYHHLFADALRIRLERTQPDASGELHRRASRWYAENGLAEASIEHALAAGDHDRAAGLLEENAGVFARQGRYATLLRRVGQLPAETVLAHPRLSVWAGRALALSGELSAAEAQLQSLERVCEPAGLTSELRGQIAAVRATAAILNADVEAAKAQSERALKLLPPGDPARAAVLLSFGDAAMMSGEFPLGIRLFGEAVELCRQHNDLSNLLTASAHLAEGFWMQGRLHQVESTCLAALEEVNHQLGAGNWPLPSLALVYSLLGAIRREWNDLPAAEEALARAVDIAERSTSLSARVNAFIGLAELRRAQGDLPQAITRIEQSIQAIHRRESALFLHIAQALRAEYWALSGDLPAALRWAEERGITAAHTVDYLGEFELHALARLWIAADRADEADALTGGLVEHAEAGGRLGKAIEFRVLQALARRSAGRPDLAAQTLERALSLGEPEGYTRTFLDEGEPLRELLRRIARGKSPAAGYARGLLATVDGAAEDQPARPGLLIEPLTERELAVLRQVAAGASNQEIAERLVISLGTVKAHIYHISAKLGARSRTEAVARARAAGLLE